MSTEIPVIVPVSVNHAVNLYKMSLDELETRYNITIPRLNFTKVMKQAMYPQTKPITPVRASYVLHQTEIMDIGFDAFEDGNYLTLSIFTGGWRSKTTTNRLNKLLNILGYVVYSVAGTWYVRNLETTELFPFEEGFMFIANKGVN